MQVWRRGGVCHFEGQKGQTSGAACQDGTGKTTTSNGAVSCHFISAIQFQCRSQHHQKTKPSTWYSLRENRRIGEIKNDDATALRARAEPPNHPPESANLKIKSIQKKHTLGIRMSVYSSKRTPTYLTGKTRTARTVRTRMAKTARNY